MSQGIKCDITEDQIMKLLERGYNMHQAALFFKVSPHTIKAHFAKLFETYGGGRLARTRLLDLMWSHAIKTGNRFALGYLAKEFLGYTEAQAVDLRSYTNKIQEMSKDEVANLLETKVKELREVKEEEG